MDTTSALYISVDEWLISLLAPWIKMKKRMELRVSRFVFLSPETVEYSQDLIAKKSAPIIREEITASYVDSCECLMMNSNFVLVDPLWGQAVGSA